MRTTRNKNLPMNSAAQVLDAARSSATALVERETRRVGSRTVAYENVGSMVGVSGSWIAKFVNRRPEVKEPGLTLGLNIIEQAKRLCGYTAACEWIEGRAATERARADALERQLNEALESIGGMVARETAPRAASKDSPSENPQ